MKRLSVFVLLLFLQGLAFGQDMWKYFTPEDFARRRTSLMEKIPDGVAILVGAELPEAYMKFRQDNTFYFLTGVEIPDAVLLLNGKTQKASLFVPDDTPDDIKKEAWITPGKEAAELYKFDNVVSKKWMGYALAHALKDNATAYLHVAPHETAGMSRDRAMMLRDKRLNDPWDRRNSREVVFANLFKEQFPAAVVKSITPIIDEMRWVKDDKEIAVLRECGRIGALGFNEAMKVTRPGIYEYQVVAACDFFYQYNGVQNPAFYAIAASGERGLTWHYNANNHPLKDGEVILLDYAPDVNYYVTDITRTWPVNGKFAADQLKFYNCIKDAHQKIIAAIKPGVTLADLTAIGKETYEKHGFGKYWFGYVGHFVGMAVHDEGPYDRPFVKGVVFNVEPIIEDKEKKIHLRLEDTIVVTENGAENLTSSTPLEPEAIYNLIREKGLWEK